VPTSPQNGRRHTGSSAAGGRLPNRNRSRWQTPVHTMTQPLPHGMVTFLFTDVEESTQLAEKTGRDFSRLMKEHLDSLRRAIEERGGVEVKTTGDGVFAVFTASSPALDAAIEIQQLAASGGGSADDDWRVRIGLHSGEADLVGGDYVGLEVHRAARVMAAAHGGQILASEPVRSSASSGHEFEDLGSHRLRGLKSPERLYQVTVPGQANEFPPLRTASLVRNNLPVRLVPLIGRESDIDALGELVEARRLVTILGPGGVGKTSVAIELGSRVAAGCPGGVVLVDLSALSDPELVVPSIASEMGAETETAEAIADEVGESDCLLILDNLEQLVAAAPDIGRILGASRQVSVLATSQVPLRIPGEHRYVLQPLGVGQGGEDAGVELFIERASDTDPGFEVDRDAIVQYLDGLPLAIELVAARAGLFTPSEMLERLRTGDMSYPSVPDSLQRHHSLEDTVEWSFGLLDTPTQQVLVRLGWFAGSLTIPAAEHVIGPDIDSPIAETTELVDRSLLVRSAGHPGRFRMLDSIRRFARRRLGQGNQEDPVRERYVEYFVDLCRGAHEGLQGDRGEWWRERLDLELVNLRDVLAILHGLQRGGEGLELLGNTWRFYQSRGHLAELDLWLDRLLALPEVAGDSAGRIKGLMARAAVAYWQKRPDEAVTGYSEAVARAREASDLPLLAEALYGLGTSFLVADRPEEARHALDECQAIYTELGDSNGLADVLAGEAFIALRTGGLAGLGTKFKEAAELYESVGRRTQATQAMYAEAGVALVEARLDDAADLVEEGLRRGIGMSDVFLQVWGIEYAARIALEKGDLERSALLAGASEAASEQIGGSWSPETIGMEDTGDRLRRLLGEDQAGELLQQGRSIDLGQAVSLALRGQEAGGTEAQG
jgi:predicted ATPase/class 3 adenylate cyclase